MDKMVSVNPRRLAFARQYFGLSVFDVAARMNVNPQQIENYESAKDYPTYAFLEKLAGYYKQPVLFFFFPSEPIEGKEQIAFRSIEQQRGMIASKKVREMIELAIEYRLNLSELLANEEKLNFHEIYTTEYQKNTELTVWLRNKLDLPFEMQLGKFSKPGLLLEYLREKLFHLGVYVFKDSFRDNSVSGLCLFDYNYPIILLNNKTTLGRQLFTLIHEVYHIILGETDIDFIGSSNEEVFCNQFASEFLIPAVDFKTITLKKRDYEDELVELELADRYCVSLGAIRYRLFKSNLISREYFISKQEEFYRPVNSTDTGGNYYYTKMSYLGKSYLNRVFQLYYSGKITASQAGLYTQVKASNIPSLASTLFGGLN